MVFQGLVQQLLPSEEGILSIDDDAYIPILYIGLTVLEMRGVLPPNLGCYLVDHPSHRLSITKSVHNGRH